MERYREKGFKLTPQRLAIIKCLEGNKNHPSADDIYQDVKKTFPTMSFATVYNNLETLREKGHISSLSIDPARRRYDPDTSCHHHPICLKCKIVVDVYADFKVNVPEEQNTAFEVLGSHIEFYGTCPECKQEEGI